MNLYKHYKGGLYVVICETANDSNNDNPKWSRQVVYYSLEKGQYNIRSLTEFHGMVELKDGTQVCRFKLVIDEDVP